MQQQHDEEKKMNDIDLPYDSNATMHAMVFHGVGQRPTLEVVPRPTLQHENDVIIRVHKTTICGTDLHILGGNVPTTAVGRILGHEGMGHVVAVGSNVQKWILGDRVLTSCITACGTCPACQRHQHAFCSAPGGWQLGHTIHGMQAEYCRIPHADFTAHALPASVPIQAGPYEDKYVMASDILPTSWEIGLRAGNIPDDATTLAIIGVGPVGLSGLLSVVAMDKKAGKTDRRIFAVDVNPNRLQVAQSMGATDCINNKNGDAVQQIMDLTNNQGVDFCVECIGLPVGWELAQDMVAMGGQITILGVHGKPGIFKLEKLWQHNVSIHTGMVHCDTIPYFLERIEQGHLDADALISHHFKLSDVEKAYDHFKNAEESCSLKVLITNDF